MSKTLIQLEDVLCEELRLFGDILHLEKEKSEAIINRNGSLLENLSREQENRLSQVAALEKGRKTLTEQYSKNNPGKTITLSEIAAIECVKDSILTQTGDLLRKTLDKIKSLQETNTRMINDNMEFFSKMVNKLKETISFETGYGKKGMERTKTLNSVLLDRMI